MREASSCAGLPIIKRRPEPLSPVTRSTRCSRAPIAPCMAQRDGGRTPMRSSLRATVTPGRPERVRLLAPRSDQRCGLRARSRDATSRAGQQGGQRPGHGYPRARSCGRHAHAGALDCCAGRVLHPRPLVLTSCPRCAPVPNRGGPVGAPTHGFRPRIAVETSAPTLEWHSATGRRRSQRDRCQRPAART